MDGRTLTESTDILNEQVNFYSNLYSSKINDTPKMRNYLDSTRLSNTLPQNDKQLCDQNITIDECRNSLFSMKLNKNPGSDGLSVEFYQTFWDHLRESYTLYKCFKRINTKGTINRYTRRWHLKFNFQVRRRNISNQLASHHSVKRRLQNNS